MEAQEDPSLKPLLRDHSSGEREALALKAAAFTSVQDQEIAVQRLAVIWKQQLEPHFLDEERLLQQYIYDKDLWNKLVEDHRVISHWVRMIIGNEEIHCSALLRLSELMQRHYAWEEEILFPSIARSLDNNCKLRLMHETHIWEALRSRNYSEQLAFRDAFGS